MREDVSRILFKIVCKLRIFNNWTKLIFLNITCTIFIALIKFVSYVYKRNLYCYHCKTIVTTYVQNVLDIDLSISMETVAYKVKSKKYIIFHVGITVRISLKKSNAVVWTFSVYYMIVRFIVFISLKKYFSNSCFRFTLIIKKSYNIDT